MAQVMPTTGDESGGLPVSDSMDEHLNGIEELSSQDVNTPETAGGAGQK